MGRAFKPLNYKPAPPRRAGRRLGIGCIGAGFIVADCHLVAYRNAGFNVAAIAARRPEQSREVAAKRGVKRAYGTYHELLADPAVEVVDIGVPPDVQFGVIRDVLKAKQVRGILAQKPLGVDYAQAKKIVKMCREAGVKLAVNQNMRWDQSVRACKDLLTRGLIGEPVLATIDMRAIPHWMPWQRRQGWLTLRIMSIHHLDTFRYWFGDPVRVFASTRTDPRTGFAHTDGICVYVLEYANGFRAAAVDDVWTGPAREGGAADIGIGWRIEGLEGMARGTIGWPKYPRREPSTIDWTTARGPGAGRWRKPRWKEAWFPDAFAGPMGDLLGAIEEGREPAVGGEDNLKTMALVDACYKSAGLHRAVEPREITGK